MLRSIRKSRLLGVARFAALLSLLISSGSAQQSSVFERIGPGGGGAMFHPTIHPHDPRVALVACDMTGSYITHNGGQSWRMFQLRGAVRFFQFDPANPRIVYAGNNALWRSSDAGKTWKLVTPDPRSIRSIAMPSDHASESIVATDAPPPFSAFALDPSRPEHLFAATDDPRQPALLESGDAGRHWTQLLQLPEPATHIWVGPPAGNAPAPGSAIPGSPVPGSPAPVVLVLTGHSLFRSQGKQFDRVPLPSAAQDAAASVSASSGWLLYLAGADGLVVSRDLGSTWQPATLPGTGAAFRAVTSSPADPRIAYASYSKLHLDGAEWQGVARTDDGGKTWTLRWKESTDPAPNLHDAWITPTFGTSWGENPLALTVAPSDPNVVYATDFGRTLVTRDGGLTWQAVYSHQTTGGAWQSTGLDVTTTYGIYFDPFAPQRQFLTNADISLFRSEDNGASWLPSGDGIPQRWRNTTYALAFDPAVPGRVWSANSGTHDLPRPKMWRHTATSKFLGGVSRSDDGGRHWTDSNRGMPETAATHILLDPASPPNRRVLYVAALGRGVYKSTDGGGSWTQKNTGILQQDPLAWRLLLAPDRSLYLVIVRRSEDGSIGNSGDGALYRSTDGAESWSLVPLPAGANGPTGLAVDPLHPGHLVLAAWARDQGTRGVGGGVFRSADGGAHWTPSLTEDQHIFDVVSDPRLPGTLYAAGFESSAWVSRDSALHWSRIPGFNFKWGQRVVPDPADPRQIYISTFGGGLWHGPAAGNAASAQTDIATPRMKPPL